MIHMMLMMVIMMFFNDHDIMIEIASQSDGPRVTPLPPEVVAVRADRTVRNMLLLLLLLLLCHAIVYVRAHMIFRWFCHAGWMLFQELLLLGIQL